MSKLINLTPHEVNLVQDETTTSYKSEGVVRVETESKQVGSVNGIGIFKTTFGAVEGLPAPQDEIFYIVSGLVLSACPERDDLLVPNDLLRNDKGLVIGCTSWRK